MPRVVFPAEIDDGAAPAQNAGSDATRARRLDPDGTRAHATAGSNLRDLARIARGGRGEADEP